MKTWQFIFSSKIAICILELFGKIMFSPICNAIRQDLNEWIDSLFLSQRKKKCASLYVILMLKIATDFGGFLSFFLIIKVLKTFRLLFV